MKDVIEVLPPTFRHMGVVMTALSAAFTGTDYIMKLKYPKDKIFLMWGSTVIIWIAYFILKIFK